MNECQLIDTVVKKPKEKTKPQVYKRKTTGFVNLHGHSQYSLLDGMKSPTEYVRRAVELNQPAVALTDHGGMWGVFELLKSANKSGIKGIPGNEMYLVDQAASRRLKEYAGNGDYKVKTRYHQLVLAVNRTGYENLSRLTSDSYTKNSETVRGKVYPLVTKEQLAAHKEGLVLTSGCLAGIVCQAILADNLEFAYETAQWYKQTFGDSYYIEIQDHAVDDDQRKVNKHLVNLAQCLNIGLVVTADSHYVRKTEKETHAKFLRINKGVKMASIYDGAFWLPSEDELKKRLLSYLPEWAVEQALDNSVLIAQQVEVINLFRKPVSPKFKLPLGTDADEYLTKLAEQGLCERGLSHKPEYKKRLAYELNILKLKKLADYFLIVQDYVAFARSREIPVGLGRGSAAGSLVAYALKITGIDPIHHGLVFSRFINEERESYPDIDLDFCIERRHEVVEYIQQKYGSENTANIITFNALKSKQALKDAGYLLGVPYNTQNHYSKQLPTVRGKNVPLQECIEIADYAPEFYKAYEEDKKLDTCSFREWANLAIELEKTVKSSGVHAAGVVIGDTHLPSLVPLQKNVDDTVVTQYDMKALEDMGLLKLDILGLKNLTILDKALRLANKTFADLENIDLEDLEVFLSLHSGETEGIFQFESNVASHILKLIKPENLEDLSAANTLNRPGCLDLEIDGVKGVHEEYAKRKHGLKPVVFSHDDLKPILKETFGITLYQEQSLKFCSEIAGWSLGRSDIARRAIGKKDLSLMALLESEFIKGCLDCGYNQQLATELWSILDASKNYSFNKSHSMSYAVVAYYCAWCKYYYPKEFFAALLSHLAGLQPDKRNEKVSRYCNLLESYGLKLMPPSINLSDADFTPVEKGIRYGLGLINGVGLKAIENILLERSLNGRFKSLVDFCHRTKANKTVVESLVSAGCFDEIESSRSSCLASVDRIADWVKKHKAFVKKEKQLELLPGLDWNQTITYPAMIKSPPLTLANKLKLEQEVLGVSLSGHLLDEFSVSEQTIDDLAVDEEFKGTVICLSYRRHNTKDGKVMGFATVCDRQGNKLDVAAFWYQWRKYGELFGYDQPIWIRGKIQEYNNKLNLKLEEACNPATVNEYTLVDF